MTTEIIKTGPIFTPGRAEGLMDKLSTESGLAVAEQGRDDVRSRLSHVLQHPTGHYWSQIQVSTVSYGHQLHDGKVVYGNWLEGTGSRNQTSRFKGYATFRTVAQALDGKAEQIVEGLVPHYLGELM